MHDRASTAELPSQSEAGARSHGQHAASPLAPDFDERVRDAAAFALRKLRRRSGLTLEHVAARASTHRPIVGRIEKGVHSVRLDTAKRIAEANGGSIRDVLEAIDQALGLGSVRP